MAGPHRLYLGQPGQLSNRSALLIITTYRVPTLDGMTKYRGRVSN